MSGGRAPPDPSWPPDEADPWLGRRLWRRLAVPGVVAAGAPPRRGRAFGPRPWSVAQRLLARQAGAAAHVRGVDGPPVVPAPPAAALPCPAPDGVAGRLPEGQARAAEAPAARLRPTGTREVPPTAAARGPVASAPAASPPFAPARAAPGPIPRHGSPAAAAAAVPIRGSQPLPGAEPPRRGEIGRPEEVVAPRRLDPAAAHAGPMDRMSVPDPRRARPDAPRAGADPGAPRAGPPPRPAAASGPDSVLARPAQPGGRGGRVGAPLTRARLGPAGRPAEGDAARPDPGRRELSGSAEAAFALAPRAPRAAGASFGPAPSPTDPAAVVPRADRPPEPVPRPPEALAPEAGRVADQVYRMIVDRLAQERRSMGW